MRFVRQSNNPNLFVGLILLILLAVFAAPSTLPRFLSNIAPQFYEGIPCSWLRTADDRAFHQSLIGRAAANPLDLRIKTTTIPTDASQSLFVSIIITNNSLGTVPFVYSPQSVLVGDNNTSGLGVIFNPPNSLSAGQPRNYGSSIPETDLRLLGPRQSCVVTLEFPGGNVLVDPNIMSGRSAVKAYYRNNTSGQVIQPTNTVATPIYPDEGLWTGYLESPSIVIPLASQ